MYKENNDFYPTPAPVIQKMLAPYLSQAAKERGFGTHYLLRGMHILEPSAGKGDILDFLRKRGNAQLNHLYAIEQDENLRHILQGKGYKVIGTDFLTTKTDYRFDLIIANPPFSTGDSHLLHMWEILKKGEIVCLLNSETLRNPYSEKRKLLLRLIEDHGSCEEIGKVFTDAERTTEVDVTIVRLQKKAKEGPDFTFKNTSREAPIDFSQAATGDRVALNDLTGSLLRCYEQTKEAFRSYLQARNALQLYAGPILEKQDSILDIAQKACQGEPSDEGRYNAFMDGFKYQAWRQILSRLKIEKYLTHSARETFEEFAKSQGAMDLTRENIFSLVMMIVQNKDSILKQAVVDVFDIFTRYHSVNRVHLEGWKTNEAWIAGPKVILPLYIEMGHGGYYHHNYARYAEFSDIDRVMCYLSGFDYDLLDQIPDGETYLPVDRMSLKSAIGTVRIGDSGWHESKFFHIRCYKKGTIHLKWKDEALRAKFNQVACDGKFNLGYSYKKSRTKKTT